MPSLLNDEVWFDYSCVLVRPPDNPRQGMILLLGGRQYLSSPRSGRREAVDSVLL